MKLNFKNMLGYLTCIAVSLFFAYYISGKGGIMLCMCLVVSLVLSAVNLFAVRKKLTFTMTPPESGDMRKGENFSVGVTLTKDSVLPTPYVEVRLSCTDNISAVKTQLFKAALTSNSKPLDITAEYSAVYSGKGMVEIQSVKITDYLGLFSVNVFETSADNRIAAEINIYPDIPVVNASGELLKSSSDAVASSDEGDEDTGETARFGGGVPGYEHRQYVPGDPLKKVNWKLSSKRNIYMVRLDEKISVTGQSIILDVFSKNPEENDPKSNDILIESAMSMLSSMLRHEVKCRCFYWEKGQWASMDIESEADLLELQKAMGEYDFYSAHFPRMPENIKTEKGSMAAIVFTNDLDPAIVSAGTDSGMPCFYAAVENAVHLACDDLWIVDDTFEFRRF